MGSQDGQSKRSEKRAKSSSSSSLLLRSVLLAAILVILLVAGAMLAQSLLQRGQPTQVQFNLPVNPALNPVEAAYLSAYLAANQAALSQPAGTDATPIEFQVTSGETASMIADKLASLGLVRDPTLLRNYLRYYGLDTSIEAGKYELDASMNVPQLAQALTKAQSPDITIRLGEGWRREQIAAWLDSQTELPFHGADFLAATSVPSPDVAAAYQLPPGATLEGFLFPDTYRLAKDATASTLVSRALENFDRLVTPQMRADSQARGMTLYQSVILASIVEREAAVDEERPLIASVYLNRLAQGIKLDADPTVQYAMGYQAATGDWWNLNLTPEDYTSVVSPYNTYLYAGLPPGPIASPGLASINAVIYPADTPYIFFRAKCDGSGQHNFAVTYEEHVANACP